MNTVFRSFLVWLLLLALPFQGVASARMLPCAPTPAVQAAPAPMGMAGHDHAAMLRAAASADIHCAGAATAQPGDCHDGHDSQDGAGHGGKGSCASCCVGAAMAPALSLRLALARPDFIAIPFRAGHVPTVDPVLPERPPRTIAA